ncbi:tigger transposable element-derived protein 3 [Drosophila guanche]|uniref:Blast:Tigger transposable element-derived protein 3 n=1 Tax=Drosophila guanche TaxID=7266 RepID=A0A3B0JVE8_DROGU|nr:tigger transposable element-derived protein 3 [Drosophila guanche]SPP75038.1 blast:Tigger transposable element-derived protein 3 [Drosophila guanche]
MPPGRRRLPRRLLTLSEKNEVIQVQEREKLSVRDLGRRFNIGKTQAAEILKNKGKIDAGLKSGVNAHIKRNCLNDQIPHIDELCYSWFTRARSENIRLSEQLVRTKAKEIAKHLGHKSFSASVSWLQKWRRRHNITFNATCETLDVKPFECVLVKNEPIINEEELNPVMGNAYVGDGSDFMHNPIVSFEEAMTQLARLKEFAKDDYISFQQLRSLENQWNYKRNNMKMEDLS